MKRLSEINYFFCSFINLTLHKLFTHILIQICMIYIFEEKKYIRTCRICIFIFGGELVYVGSQLTYVFTFTHTQSHSHPNIPCPLPPPPPIS